MSKDQLNIIITGKPGSGKDTQAERICERYNLALINTGDIFRNNRDLEVDGMTVGDILDGKDYVPDEQTNQIVIEYENKKDPKNGFVYDGYPRTIPQAEFLSDRRDIDRVYKLDVSDQEVIDRIEKRGERPNDTKRGAWDRLKNYADKASKIPNFYEDKLKVIDGEQKIEEVFLDIKRDLEKHVLPEKELELQ